MTGKVDLNTLESNPFDNVFSIIDNRTYVPDPRGTTSRKFVYDKDPSAKGLQFGDFPYIVVKLPVLENMKEKQSSDGTFTQLEWTQAIIVRTSMKGANNNTTDTGRKDILSIGDSLNSTFNSLEVRQILFDWDMKEVKLNKINNDEIEIDQESIREAEYELTYRMRMKVSE